jgi:hypothetical protein
MSAFNAAQGWGKVNEALARTQELIMKNGIVALVVAALLLAGCSDLTPGQQRAATGAGIGAAGGAVIGALAGNAALGAGIGAGAGLLGGVLVNSWKNNEQQSYEKGYNAGRSSQPQTSQ